MLRTDLLLCNGQQHAACLSTKFGLGFLVQPNVELLGNQHDGCILPVFDVVALDYSQKNLRIGIGFGSEGGFCHDVVFHTFLTSQSNDQQRNFDSNLLRNRIIIDLMDLTDCEFFSR